jgi:hypothetical protein
MIMKAGTITAKIRDAVWVRFMEGETERVRYRNIEMPLAFKDLEIQDFTFDLPTDASGKITFKLYFAEGVLPEEFPAPRPRVTKAEKAAAKVTEAITEAKIAEPEATTALMVMPETNSVVEASTPEKPKAKRGGKRKTA